MEFSIYVLIAISLITTQTIAEQSKCLFSRCFCSFKSTQPNRIEKVDCKDLHLGSLPNKEANAYDYQIDLVDLSGNDLQDIKFESLSELYITTLNLSNNQLRLVPTSLLRNIAKFENLYLSDNQLQQISSASFKDFDYTIKNLSLSGNKLENSPSFDYAFKQFEKLEFLDLSNNKLKHVPYFYSLRKLRILKLNNNNIETLNFVLTPDVTTLIIQTKPTAFPDFINELYLQNNQIEKIDELSISNLYELKILDLSNNQISFINKDTFKNFKKLTTLHLQYNKLTRIPSETFVKLSKLNNLDLSYQTHGTQGLRAIEKYAFDREDPQEQLHTVLLTGNKIETISNKAFCSRLNDNVRHVHIKYLNIDNNPLVNANTCVFRQLNMKNSKDDTVLLYLNTIIKTIPGLNETEQIINCSSCDAFEYLGHYNIMLNARCTYDGSMNPRYRRAYDRTCVTGNKAVAELCFDRKEYDCYEEVKSDSKIMTSNFMMIFICLVLATIIKI